MPVPAFPSPARSAGPLSVGSLVAVAIGGAGGTAVRYAVWNLEWRPLLTLVVVNTVGSFALGLIVAVRTGGLADRWTALAGVGFCGGLTTFSTHAVEVAQRFDDGQWTSAFLSLAGTTTLCVAAAGLGFRLLRDAPGKAST